MLIDDFSTAIACDEVLTQKEYCNEIAEDMDLNKLEMDYVTFTKCKFINCNFAGGTFRHTSFMQCDFSNCNFQDSYWKEVEFTECKGDGSNFSHSSLIGTKFYEGNYHYANFSMTRWENTKIEASDLYDSFFSQTKFKKMIFQNVNLMKCDFFKTPLKGIDLSDCIVEGITVSDTFQELRGVKLNPEQAVSIALLLGVKFI